MSTLSRSRIDVGPQPLPAAGVIVRTGRGTLVIPPEAHQLEGFREWSLQIDYPGRVRVTFLQGEIIIDMSNEEPISHVGVKTEISRVLSSLVKEENRGRFFADGVLVTNVEAEVSNNPDATFLSKTTLDNRIAYLVPRKGAEHVYRDIEGTPDWVLEVVSDSSVGKDTKRLRAAYHKAGIGEYWIVDARGEELVFQILTRRKSGYVQVTMKDGWQASRVFGRSFRLARERDDYGLWDYTLHVREG